MKKRNIFVLVNNEGLIICREMDNNFKSARKHFNYRYSGNFKILEYNGIDETVISKNVRLR
jgi:hypothetical protein